MGQIACGRAWMTLGAYEIAKEPQALERFFEVDRHTVSQEPLRN